ncbi:unnamed protein product [Didymodactylos carnosus]|uniref:RING-type domain-containing protein n=1 Tax=Didymodactylos carnosus TaxID=1234261 RepID=A0A814X8A9_9BILA|nr:unnamed protein product [Didymodactylos carnosus]CAF1214423.1 unnamed protein product [Didymodactylos carnosus]CAF3918704.1 unnamed protein product [Didymodactylos carnosus]CAF3978294.1 unnamed protein product [Didymodactylos carnosus]
MTASQIPILCKCVTCDIELSDNHLGIQCSRQHHYCRDCCQNFVTLFFSEPQLHIPLTCLECSEKIPEYQFERQLTDDQFEKYQSIMLTMQWWDECDKEYLAHCPYCQYVEIREHDKSIFLFCKYIQCRRVSCLVCKHECQTVNDYMDENIDDILGHSKCVELKHDKKIVDLAIINGSMIPCPTCGVSGMKDDNCTHMTCGKCCEYWCYFCGQKQEDCDVPDGHDVSLSNHNIDWDSNSQRCPMYLVSIKEFDQRWPDDDYECLEYFHRYRTLTLLYEVCKIIGEEKMNEIDEHFHSLHSCSYTMKEIQESGKSILIDYDREYQDQ